MSNEPEGRPSDQSRLFLAAIVESSDDAIVSKNLDGTILSWNAGARRLFGYTAEEAVGRHITMIIPEDRRSEETDIINRLRRGERIEHYETVRVAKDGSLREVSLAISPIRNERGEIFAASKVCRDISERKQAERELQALREAEAAQLAALERLQEMGARMWTMQERRPILEEMLRTAAAIEGASRGLVSLRTADGDLEVAASLGFDDKFLQAVAPVGAGEVACIADFADRRSVVVEDVEADPLFAPIRDVARSAGFRAVHTTPLVTRDGRCIGVLSTHFDRPHRPSNRTCYLVDLVARQAVDFLENLRLHAELLEADRRKDEFLATLAHELRNPLSPISNSLHILRMSGELSPSAERVRGIMERQVGIMVRLVDDLLEVSRITRGKIELRCEAVELAAVVRSAVETSRPLIDAAGHQLALAIVPEPLRLEADPVRLAQVLANLLNNAAKYTERGGQIKLTVTRDESHAVIVVADNGLGIPPEMLPRVFDMFSQIDRTLNRAQGGLGIGLTLAKNLVEMHGGTITASSSGPGLGSEFKIRLPLALHDLPSAGPIDPPGAIVPRHILVVDDARFATYTLGKLLEHLGQRVTTANDAMTALDAARRLRPDMIISDIGMPGIDGYELAARLRREPGLEATTLVALTGYGEESDRLRAMEAGFHHHLVKPVSVEALRELMARATAAELTENPEQTEIH